jgi:hypothetical protein
MGTASWRPKKQQPYHSNSGSCAEGAVRPAQHTARACRELSLSTTLRMRMMSHPCMQAHRSLQTNSSRLRLPPSLRLTTKTRDTPHPAVPTPRCWTQTAHDHGVHMCSRTRTTQPEATRRAPTGCSSVPRAWVRKLQAQCWACLRHADSAHVRAANNSKNATPPPHSVAAGHTTRTRVRARLAARRMDAITRHTQVAAANTTARSLPPPRAPPVAVLRARMHAGMHACIRACMQGLKKTPPAAR